VGNAISKTKNFKNREGNRMPPDPQRNARFQAKINFPISGKRGFFLLLANTLLLHILNGKYWYRVSFFSLFTYDFSVYFAFEGPEHVQLFFAFDY
jgi:hypothetical protein